MWLKPFPIVERAYAHVGREDVRQSVMALGVEAATNDVVMAIRGMKSDQSLTLVKSGSINGGRSNSS